MTTRRSFLGTVSGGLGAAVALDGLARAAGGAKPPVGLQLWSLRDALAKDLPGTLRQIKGWGIDEVESAGYYGRTAAEFAGELKKAGLRCQAQHVGWDALSAGLDGVLKDAEAVGATTVIQPSLPHATRGKATREEILRAAEVFAKWSGKCKAAGRRFGYHLHGQEFSPAPEGTLFDLLAKEAGPDLGFEFDVFWVVAGGADPVELMGRYPGRVWYTHLKDMEKASAPADGRRVPANVVLGTGRIDIAGVVRAGRAGGVEIHFIEDESPDPAGQIPKSLAYYQSLGV